MFLAPPPPTILDLLVRRYGQRKRFEGEVRVGVMWPVPSNHRALNARSFDSFYFLPIHGFEQIRILLMVMTIFMGHTASATKRFSEFFQDKRQISCPLKLFIFLISWRKRNELKTGFFFYNFLNACYCLSRARWRG